MSKKVILSRNESEIKKQLNEYKELCSQLNAGHKLVSEFTEGEVTELDLEAVHKWLSDKTGFDNPSLTSQLLNKQDMYNTVLRVIYLSETPKAKNLSKRGTQYSLSKSKQQEVEDSLTTYLSSRLEGDYEKLQEIIKIIDTMTFKQGYNAITMKMGVNKPQLDLTALQREFFLRGR